VGSALSHVPESGGGNAPLADSRYRHWPEQQQLEKMCL